MKTKFGALLGLFLLSTTVCAKVTLDSVYQQESATNNAHLGSAPTRGLDTHAHGVRSGQDTGKAWRTHWSGNTSGRIGIPGDATEVFIMTSEGSHTIPKNSGHISFGKTFTVAKSHSCNGGSISVDAGFNGGAVWGGSNSTTIACESSSGRNYTRTSTASIRIYKVMVR
ncbi:hypothetical protein [Vibrio nigripulchritudo]|uniref:hypothetical protein n=1 Tax=Vibrio nigripulchritudo TaxID=28173 RepID=UPI00190D5F74|nr:hypothetical protein [Vibrio nigripulchritudo]